MQAKKNALLKFRTIIKQAGKTATGIQVPPEIVEGLGAGKKPPVTITINGYTYRNTIAVMGGVYMVGVSAEHRAGAGVAGGDEVDVTIALDTAPRVVEVPEDLQKALEVNPIARQNFEALSYSNKQRHVLPVKDAKTEETRLKRIRKTIDELSSGK